MAMEAIVALCVLVFTQGTSSQCLPFQEYGCNSVGPASTGGSFIVTSFSPVAPTGISVVSNNQYDGSLVVEGSLPLLGSVAVEGVMGTAGAGAVSYGCGDEVVDIVEEGPIVTGITSDDLGYGDGLSGLGLGYGSGLYGLNYGNGLYGLGLAYGNGLYGFGLNYGNGLLGYGLGYNNGLYGFGYGSGLYGLNSGCGLSAFSL